MADLTGKITLITAAAQGIGRASVEAFARAGAKVIATDINADKLKELDGLANVTTRVLNVLSADEVNKAVAEIGRIDILFNCAGAGKSLDGSAADALRGSSDERDLAGQVGHVQSSGKARLSYRLDRAWTRRN